MAIFFSSSQNVSLKNFPNLSWFAPPAKIQLIHPPLGFTATFYVIKMLQGLRYGDFVDLLA